jgi:F420-non-reducing hydrogenase small subunit
MAEKPKLAILWLGGCGGCDETIVDINEVLLSVAGAVDFVLWPVALDFKYHHVESLGDGEIALSIINGHVRNSEHEEMARLLRKKSRLVMAFGACAGLGGTPSLANFRTRDDIMRWVYQEAPTVVNPKGSYPQPRNTVAGNELSLPELYERVYALNQVIDVDYYLPGCPPPPYLVLSAVSALLEDKLPPKGSTLAPRKALCDTCPRNTSKPVRLALKEIKRIHEVEADPKTCFLAQGILCLGPATRSGCGESCIDINLPCRGCFGAVEGVADSGTKFVSALASMLDAETEEQVASVTGQLDDLVGYLYRFSSPVSILGSRTLPSK